MAHHLQVIFAATREGRVGAPVAEWAVEHAKRHGKFDVEYLDLREVKLPMFDEPEHPSQQKYVHEHTKKWSATISRGDCFLIVTPEYNHMLPPALLNAIDYLVKEWAYKPAAVVSYGGVSAGTRAMERVISVFSGLKVPVIPEAVNAPFFSKSIKDGKFDGAIHEKALGNALNELERWTTALKTLRSPS